MVVFPADHFITYYMYRMGHEKRAAHKCYIKLILTMY